MNRIRILHSDVAGKIAAGEVILGPVSVVKELVENAVDAGATAVTVEVKGGGRESIRVTDNGSGIHPDDVLMAIQKHATSKIASSEDMERIASLGFRGEALPSIAAVSHITVKTRAKGQEEGCVLEQDGATYAVKPAGLPDGTTVLAENLFYNVPARLKFLKSAAAEGAAVSDLMGRLALSSPEISFKYIANGKLQFQSPGTGLTDAIIAVYGKDIPARLLEFCAKAGEIQIAGHISNPNYLFKTSKNQTFVVNRRYVRSKAIADALKHAYGEQLLMAHFPFAILHFTIPLHRVDVNVHPGKTTIRIDDEAELLALLDAAVRDALSGGRIPAMDFSKNTDNLKNRWVCQNETQYAPACRTGPSDTYAEQMSADGRFVIDSPLRFKEDDLDDFALEASAPLTIKPEKVVENQQHFSLSDMAEYKIIGQLFGTYIVVEAGDVVYIIDQHAAHERMNYERMKSAETLLPQQLLLPYALRLSQNDHDFLIQNADFLCDMGFELEDFGGSTIKITALPLRGNQGDIGLLMEDVLELLRGYDRNDPVFRDKIVRRACRISIKAGESLSEEEMRLLVHELRDSDTVPVCPHGRPVAVVLTRAQLEKNFKRIV